MRHHKICVFILTCATQTGYATVWTSIEVHWLLGFAIQFMAWLILVPLINQLNSHCYCCRCCLLLWRKDTVFFFKFKINYAVLCVLWNPVRKTVQNLIRCMDSSLDKKKLQFPCFATIKNVKWKCVWRCNGVTCHPVT